MNNNQSWQDQIYVAVARKSPRIIFGFNFLYGALILFLIVAGWDTLNRPAGESSFYRIGVYFGRGALVLLGIIVLPGILGRLGVEVKITRIITLFRRQLGITTFLIAFTHYQLARGFLFFSGKIPFILPRPLFETIGFLALSLMFLMFLTSNNLSVKRLGKWWKRLHRIIYLILWLLVLHTGLQRISFWTWLIGIMAILEVVSLIYNYFKKKQKVLATRSVTKTEL